MTNNAAMIMIGDMIRLDRQQPHSLKANQNCAAAAAAAWLAERVRINQQEVLAISCAGLRQIRWIWICECIIEVGV